MNFKEEFNKLVNSLFTEYKGRYLKYFIDIINILTSDNSSPVEVIHARGDYATLKERFDAIRRGDNTREYDIDIIGNFIINNSLNSLIYDIEFYGNTEEREGKLYSVGEKMPNGAYRLKPSTVNKNLLTSKWLKGSIDVSTGEFIESEGYHTDYIPSEPNIHYTYTEDNELTQRLAFFYDKNYNLLDSVKASYFKTPPYTKYLAFKSETLPIKSQLEHGSTLSEYQEHDSSSHEFFLTLPLESVGNVRDRLYYNKDFDEWYIEKWIATKNNTLEELLSYGKPFLYQEPNIGKRALDEPIQIPTGYKERFLNLRTFKDITYFIFRDADVKPLTKLKAIYNVNGRILTQHYLLEDIADTLEDINKAYYNSSTSRTTFKDKVTLYNCDNGYTSRARLEGSLLANLYDNSYYETDANTLYQGGQFTLHRRYPNDVFVKFKTHNPLKPNTTYTLGIDAVSFNHSSLLVLLQDDTTMNPQRIQVSLSEGYNKITFTTNNNPGQYLILGVTDDSNNDNYVRFTDKVLILEGDVKLPSNYFEEFTGADALADKHPYLLSVCNDNESKAFLPKEVKLRRINNVFDGISDRGGYKYNKRLNETFIDSHSAWISFDNSLGFSRAYLSIADKQPGGEIFSSKYNVSKGNKPNTLTSDGAGIYLNLDKKVNTLDEFREEVRKKPFTLLYELSEPIITDCIDINLRTFLGDTTFSSEGLNISPVIIFSISPNIANTVTKLSDKVESLEYFIEDSIQVINDVSKA